MFENILKLKQEGKTTSEICDALNIKKGTVGYHLKKARELGYNYITTRPSNTWRKEILDKINLKKRETSLKKLFEKNFDILSLELKKKRIIIEQNKKCSHCGMSEWFGKPLNFELDHIDGNRDNNLRENLEILCPNCHSFTNTWRGRNKNNKRLKISDEDIIPILLKNSLNIRQSLIELNMSPKGGNYKRIYKIIDKYQLNSPIA